MRTPISSTVSEGSVVDVNTTPLIDVMLCLLIILMLSLPKMTDAVKINMPRTPVTPPVQQPRTAEIEVDFDGSLLWNGSPVTEAALLANLRSAAGAGPDMEVHVRANRLAKYDYVAKVLASAQKAGVQKLGFVGNEQFL